MVRTLRSPLIRTLEYRMHTKHMSNFIIETGKKGSGKSWLGLRLGQVIMGEDKFSMDNVCFSSSVLFDRLEKGFYKEGDVVLLEELGISANSRDAMTKVNKHLSFIAQAIRPERITLIANTIAWGLIDCQVKNMADYRIKITGYDTQTELTEFKFMVLSPSDGSQEPWQEHLQFGKEKYTSWEMKRPTKAITDIYEPLRKQYLKQLYAGGKINDNAMFGVEQKKATVPVKVGVKELIERGLSMKDDLMENGKIRVSLVELKLGIEDRHKAGTVAKGIRLRWQELGGTPI